MKKKVTPVAILLILGLIYYISFNYIYTSATNEIITQQLATAKNQANIVSNLLSERLHNGVSQKQVKEELQKSIENSSTATSFICMFDDNGREICHPKKEKIGKVLAENNSIIHSISNDELEENFKDAIVKKRATGGLRKLKTYTEIVYLSPVKETNWVVASHANVNNFKSIFSRLKEKLALLFIIIWLSSAFLIYYTLQRINSNYLAKLQEVNSTISTKYFQEISKINTNEKATYIDRILADKGAQLSPVFVKDIALIYTENKITYVLTKDKQQYTINLALDELFKSLDNSLFYRASRQVIVAAAAITKVAKYGNTQLQVYTNPDSPNQIIVSKTKLSEFKKWLGKN